MTKGMTTGDEAIGKSGGSLIPVWEKTLVLWDNITPKSQFPAERFSSSSVTCRTVVPQRHLDGENNFVGGGVSLEQQKPPSSEVHPQRSAGQDNAITSGQN